MEILSQMNDHSEDENSEDLMDANVENSDEDRKNKNSKTESNEGWVNSIAKVLSSRKPRKKKTIVLSRAKKIRTDNKEKEKPYDFEIAGEIKEEIPDRKNIPKDIAGREKLKATTLDLRVRPSINDREREKALKKIATKGVVQLFNAVRAQQKELEEKLEEAGPLEQKRDAVLNSIDKKKFLNVLMGGERAKSEAVDNPIKEEEIKDESDSDPEDKSKPEWSVLRDDFMTNKKLKNWDQEENDADENNSNGESDSD